MTQSDYVAVEQVDGAPLLQGDLFKWLDPNFCRPWSAYGVVVTADCDLVRSKTNGVVSYIPGLIMEDYVWHYWKTGRFSATLETILHKFCNRINNRLRKLSNQHRDISKEAVMHWLNRVGPEGLVVELQISDAGQKSELLAMAGELQTLKSLEDTPAPDMGLLHDCYRLKHKGKKIKDGDFSAIADEIQSSISSLPGDVFFLPLDEHEHGLFLMLRHIRQLDLSRLATSVADMTVGEPHAQRLGRITAPYRYAITQNLARVFADIGLPSSYEERRDRSSRKFFKVS
ncbi:hypothetical protein JQ544_11565 [Bradyrhizobium diazoefficiens]|nr:hypothetical protein [Bradyrhizobium diazoefficiens]MBR0812165.1 hypothetical protein [Bradyrhizobium diazoefficiens]